MAAKTANVLARVEPETKEKAEAILERLGVPASVVINTLYKQIILTNRIPFVISLPSPPLARDEIDDETLVSMINTSLEQAKSGQSQKVSDVSAELRRGL